MEGITLQAAVLALLGNGMMGYVVFYVFNKLAEWLEWLDCADMEMKRVCLAVLSFVAVQPVFWAGVGLRVIDMPPDAYQWVYQTFVFASIAFVAATVKHGAAQDAMVKKMFT